MATKRTTLRSSKGKKLYAVRDSGGKFKDIQTYKRAHGADMKRKSKAESVAKAKKKTAKKAAPKKAAKKAAPKKAAKKMVRRTPAKKAAKKTMKKTAKRMPAKKAAARRPAAKKAPAKKAARKAPAKKAAVRKAPAKKASKGIVGTAVTQVKQAVQAISERPMVEKATQAASSAMDSAKTVAGDMATSVTGMMKSVAAKASQVVDDVKDAAQRVTGSEPSSS